jgi:hypothetical protein
MQCSHYYLKLDTLFEPTDIFEVQSTALAKTSFNQPLFSHKNQKGGQGVVFSTVTGYGLDD